MLTWTPPSDWTHVTDQRLGWLEEDRGTVQQLTVDVNNLVTEIPEQTACADVTDQEELARSSMVAVAVERVMFACCRTLSGGDSYLVVNQLFANAAVTVTPESRLAPPVRISMLSSRLVSVESVDVFKVTHFADDGTDECWCHIYTAVVDEIDFAKGVDGSISDRHMSISYVEAPVTAEELSPRPNPP
ncbi:hypothetical protein CYMTET_12513 [Cymbomonas tetramitiformis]|uniref:Uncharacterized protein n=1 Tax=Cymbomonas tetramitiformis TaxID=36881 RepID=A0AAE0GKE2_9CHLO|nr:hypothetical protein CYMTET_12513 [Cymbomonas tetramitiformis]